MIERCFRELAHFHAWPTSCLLCAVFVSAGGWTCTAQRLCLIFCQLLQKYLDTYDIFMQDAALQ